MIKRSARIKITTVRRRTIRATGSLLRAACPACERDVEMLTRIQATGILDIDDRTFDGLIAVGRIHVIQTVTGALWICKDSLFLGERIL